MRIVTWNMNYMSRKDRHEDAWNYLIDELHPDIALVQEARPPTNFSFDSRLLWHQILDRGDWGSGIYSKNYPLREIDFENSYPGSLVGAEIKLPNGEMMAVFSLYGKLDRKNGDKTGYATTSVHKMISELTWILIGSPSFKGLNKNLVIGGDFNISVQCDIDQQKKSDGGYRNAHRLLFERICDFGLHSVFDWSGKDGFKQTLRHTTSKEPWQNDYIFLSQRLNEKKMREPEVHLNEKICELSDHNPIIVDIDISYTDSMN